MFSGALVSGPVGTLSWTGVSFGGPAPDRELVLAWCATRSTAGMSVIGGEIAGQSADIHVDQYNNSGGFYARSGVRSVRDTSTASGDVRFVFSAGVSMHAALYRVTGLKSRVATDTQQDFTGGTGDLSVNSAIQPGGVTFAALRTRAVLPTATVTHSGVGTDYNYSVNPDTITFGHQLSNFAATLAIETIAAGPGDSKFGHSIATASFK